MKNDGNRLPLYHLGVGGTCFTDHLLFSGSAHSKTIQKESVFVFFISFLECQRISVTSALNFVFNRPVDNVRPRQRRKGTRQGRSQAPSQSAPRQHPGNHQGKSKEGRKFRIWPNFLIFSLPSVVWRVAAASSASPDSSTRKLVACSR